MLLRMDLREYQSVAIQFYKHLIRLLDNRARFCYVATLFDFQMLNFVFLFFNYHDV